VSQPQQPSPLMALLNALARTADATMAASQGVQGSTSSSTKNRPACTPCAAAARRRKAQRLVRGR